MPIYAINNDDLVLQKPTQFEELKIRERTDLQRLLRSHPDALDDDLLVIAEEFGDWEDSRRRIDLLALDRDRRLVVIELKRTSDGGHMELQALRYAAMASAMTFDEVVATYAHFLAVRGAPTTEARTELAEFLGLEPSDDIELSSDVRIILVSADFGREITTTVLWLNAFDRMDIRCVRLIPYQIEGHTYLDIEQVIPLPEAADYQVRLRKKDNAQARSRVAADGRDFTRYHIVVNGHELPDQNKRKAVHTMITELAKAGVTYTDMAAQLSAQALKSLPGRVTDPDEVYAELAEIHGMADPGRWFYETPQFDEATNQTWVIYRMWAANTEDTLTKLRNAFPEAKVGFRVAD